jgi:multidrug resistance efflux pump
MFHKYVLPVLAVIALTAAAVYVAKNHSDSRASAEPPRQPAAKPADTVLAGAGIVEPTSDNISVGASVPGVVVWVIDDDMVGKPVRKGDPLFRLDNRQLKKELAVRKASLASAKLQYDKLKAMPRPEDLEIKELSIKELEPTILTAEKTYDEYTKLLPKGGVSRADWGMSYTHLLALKAQKSRLEAELKELKAGTWEPDLAVAQAAIDLAQAQVRQTEDDLDRLEVRALEDAVLLQIKVRPGQFVSTPSADTLILLGNLTDLHVRVDIDEHDAPLFRRGMPATGYLHGQPDYPYELEFVRVEPYLVTKKSLTGGNSERLDTRVLQVIYRIKTRPDPEHEARVGHQMDVFFGKAEGGPP